MTMPRTAYEGETDASISPGNKQDEGQRAKTLGWLSLGLGMTQLLAPGVLSNIIGAPDGGGSRAAQRAIGLRELAAGAGILGTARPAPWLWGRVMGDVMDLALLGAAMGGRSSKRARLAVATAGVAGITAADVQAARAASANPPGARAHVTRAVTVRRGPLEVYEYWRDFANLPRFMAHLESVNVLDERRSRWRSHAPFGKSIEWDATITEDRPGELLAWKSVDGGGFDNAGMVEFRAAPREQGTEVVVRAEYTRPAGLAGETIATLLGHEPGQQVGDDLRRFKQIMEVGEVVRSDGSPLGVSRTQMLKQRSARPLDDASRDAALAQPTKAATR